LESSPNLTLSLDLSYIRGSKLTAVANLEVLVDRSLPRIKELVIPQFSRACVISKTISFSSSVNGTDMLLC
jgi:hypothetical protein